MIICGLKLTHDGCIALIDEGRLVFSIEMEKLSNNRRYQEINDIGILPSILSHFGYDMAQIDQLIIDGWDGRTTSTINTSDLGQKQTIEAAPYFEVDRSKDILLSKKAGTVRILGKEYPFSSFTHVANHVAGAWCSSPFASVGKGSLSLVWDGGIFPQLYYVDPRQNCITSLGPLFLLTGHAYAAIGQHFGPFKKTKKSSVADDLSIAGKLMAYVALGVPRMEIENIFESIYLARFESTDAVAVEYRRTIKGLGTGAEPSVPALHDYFSACAEHLSSWNDEDILASFHSFLEKLLVSRLAARLVIGDDSYESNLCISGGCGLNIKWNSAIRNSGLFNEVWVPPFPNDSGGAIGAACCGMLSHHPFKGLKWNAFCGPNLKPIPDEHIGWKKMPCTYLEVAQLLERGELVVLLSGQAELGPRALGNRSIIAAPTLSSTKDELNRVKKRENYRPVAPICLEDRAPEIFCPGTPDPFMLFDHKVDPLWARRIPAVIHLDGTARLQTVRREDERAIAKILVEYERISGIPVLCNTSANHAGRGFFPDAASALDWGMVSNIWQDGFLFRKADGYAPIWKKYIVDWGNWLRLKLTPK